MKKTYTRIPLEKPCQASKGDKALWVPTLLVRLGTNKHALTPRFHAVVDSGSPYCMFKREIGEAIGIDVVKDPQETVGGIIQGIREPIYFHKVKIYIEADWVIEIMAGFVGKLVVNGILGRNGFFDNFHVRFDHSGLAPQFEISKIERLQ